MHEYRLIDNKPNNKPPGCDLGNKKNSLRVIFFILFIFWNPIWIGEDLIWFDIIYLFIFIIIIFGLARWLGALSNLQKEQHA